MHSYRFIFCCALYRSALIGGSATVYRVVPCIRAYIISCVQWASTVPHYLNRKSPCLSLHHISPVRLGGWSTLVPTIEEAMSLIIHNPITQ